MSVKGEEKARSPYQRHNKAPYLYSQELRNWHDAIRRNDHNAAAAADRAWQKKFGIRDSARQRAFREAAE